MDQDQAAQVQVIHEGYLSVKRHILKGNKRRWVVMMHSLTPQMEPIFALHYYRRDNRKRERGVFLLNPETTLTSSYKNGFTLTDDNRQSFRFVAPTHKEKVVWMAKLREALGKGTAFHVQTTSTLDVIPKDATLQLTARDIVLVNPIDAMSTRSWSIAALHSFGASGPLVWLQQCQCGDHVITTSPVFLTMGSGASAAQRLYQDIVRRAASVSICGTQSRSTGQHSWQCHVLDHARHAPRSSTPDAAGGRARFPPHPPRPSQSSSMPDDVFTAAFGLKEKTQSDSGVNLSLPTSSQSCDDLITARVRAYVYAPRARAAASVDSVLTPDAPPPPPRPQHTFSPCPKRKQIHYQYMVKSASADAVKKTESPLIGKMEIVRKRGMKKFDST